MANRAALAVEHDDLDNDVPAFDDARRVLTCGTRDDVAELDARLRGMAKRFRRRVSGQDFLTQRGRAAGSAREFGERGEIDRAARGMQVEQALRELRHLGDAAG